jgi:1-acyl-sn-glycerol-3-phosphate acyltransferase
MQEPRAGDQPPRPRTDAFLRWLGRYVFTAYFRQIEITGGDRIPSFGPVIIVAKHSNSLVDGGFISTYLPRMPRVLAASTIWDYKPLVPLLNAAGVIPLFRRQDKRASNSRNKQSVTGSWDLLADGGVLALFPEGISHNDPFVKPMKSGAARIALEAERHRGPLNISIIPVGLNFEDKSKFRSRVLMQIGDPLTVSDIVNNYRHAEQSERAKYVHQLSERIHEGLLAVSPSFDTWEEARLVGRAADIWGRQDLEPAAEVDFVETVELRRGFAQGYHWMRKNYPESATDFWQTMTEYDQLLSTAGLRDQQLVATDPISSTFGFALKSTLKLAIRLPLSLIGTVLNLIPLQISSVVGRQSDPDKRATWSIFSSVLLFPVFWTLQAIVAGLISAQYLGSIWGWLAGFAVFLAGPIFGRLSLTFHDFRRQMTHEIHAWLVLRKKKNLMENLVETRQNLIAELTELVEYYDANVDTETSQN